MPASATPDPAVPYLSVVVTTRNDDHGGNPLERLQAFVNCFDEQCRRTGLDAEVIVVEWNPPPERPRVGSLLRLPERCVCTYRFIDVPAELHDGLRYADVLPLFQMIAKNVGIRRARGRFVLATNIDIIFSTELVAYLASQPLKPGHLYRVDRHDVQSDVPVDAGLEAQMAHCATQQLRIHTRCGSYPVDANGCRVCLPADIVDGRRVRLGDGWHVREGGSGTAFYRWAGDRAQLIVEGAEARSGATVLEIEVESNPYDARSWVKLEALEGNRTVAHEHLTGRMRLQVPLEPADESGDRTIDLLVIETHARPRLHLPVFERRDEMHYRVYSARLRPSIPDRSMAEYPLSDWKNANPDSAQTVKTTTEGLLVASDPLKWSYSVHYGPLRAPSRGTYRFELACSVLEGRILVGVLSGDRHEWIPATIEVHQSATLRRFAISVDLRRHEPFWLMIYNDHPDGDGVSKFIVQRLAGPVDLAQTAGGQPSRLHAMPFLERIAAIGRSATTPARDLWVRAVPPWRWRARATGLADVAARWIGARLGARMRGRIVRAAPEYRSVEKMLRGTDERLRALTPLCDLADLHKFLRERRPDNLHVNACGDFQLMARAHWDELRAYPEFETFSMNIDGLFSYVANAAGITEQALDMPIYHLEHEVGSGWSPEGEALLRRRIAERGITWIDAGTVYIWASYMRWLERPTIFNDSNWGMGNIELAERTVMPACGTLS